MLSTDLSNQAPQHQTLCDGLMCISALAISLNIVGLDYLVMLFLSVMTDHRQGLHSSAFHLPRLMNVMTGSISRLAK